MVVAIEPLNVAYMAVPKAGSSSVKGMLAQIDPQVSDDEPDALGQREIHEMYTTRRFRKARFDRYKGGFRFTVVRDPIQRLLSVFTNRVVDKQDLHKSVKLRRNKNLPVDPDPDTFFQNLDAYSRLSWAVRHHVLPTRLFTGDDLGVYDQIYRTGQMDEVAGTLSVISGKQVTAPRNNSSGARLEFDDLAPRTRASLFAYLKSEYTFLAGYVENRLT